MQRSELEDLTGEWISLWSAPVNWARFDQLHADDKVSSRKRVPPVRSKSCAAPTNAFICYNFHNRYPYHSDR